MMISTSITEALERFTDISQLQKLKTSYIYHVGRGNISNKAIKIVSLKVKIINQLLNNWYSPDYSESEKMKPRMAPVWK